MGVRNGGRYLGEAVRSLLNQTFGDWELLLIENGSTDGAVDELEASRPDARIRIIRHAQSIGAGNALIAGCVVATGRYVAVLDHDDLALPRRLEVQRGFLEQHPEISLVGSVTEVIDSDGRSLGCEPCVAWHDDIYAMTAYVHVLRHSSVMFRREILKKTPYRGSLDTAEDFDLFARTVENFRVACVPVKLCQYRLHGDNLTVTNKPAAAMGGALVRMLTRRRRLGLAEDFSPWHARFLDLVAQPSRSEAEVHLGYARIFREEGYFDLAALHAWLALRTGGGLRAWWAYSWAVLRAGVRTKDASLDLAKAWIKEPAHQMLVRNGMPDRMQF